MSARPVSVSRSHLSGLRVSLLTLLPLLLLAPAAALAAPANVTLRVEGATSTIYEGPVTSDAHAVSTPTAGAHTCDGTNFGAHPTPRPTATGVLDDGARLGAFTWDGTWFASFEDFSVDRVGPESATPSQFWGLVVNGRFATAGGCQTHVVTGDEVVWVFDAFSKLHILRLSGPTSAHVGDTVPLSVADTLDGAPMSGADITAAGLAGGQTGLDGVAHVTFAQRGVYRLKASRGDSVRSNVLVLCVDPAGAEPCTSSDATPPSVSLTLPRASAATAKKGSQLPNRSRTITLSWQGVEGQAGDSGVATYTAEAREVANGVAAAQADAWRTLLFRSPLTSTRFRGRPGRTYEFRITAYDRAGNASSPGTGTMSFPVDDRNRRILRLSRGWKGVKSKAAYGGRLVRSRKAGATATMRFQGTGAAVIGRKLPKGGRVEVTVDGKSRVVRLRGKAVNREVLYVTPKLDAGTHRLRLRALDGAAVTIDAVAPSP